MMPLAAEPALRAVLRKLAPMADEQVVVRCAHGIAMAEFLARIAEPARRRRGSNDALRYFKAVHTQIGKLADKISEMDHDASTAMMKTGRKTVNDLLRSLAEMDSLIVDAHAFVAGATPVPGRTKGRLSEAVPRRVAERALLAFTTLSGNAPTRGRDRITGAPSACQLFLADVFATLGIKKDPEHYVRVLLEK